LEKTDGTNSAGSKEYSEIIDKGVKSDKIINIRWYNKGDSKPNNVIETETKQPPQDSSKINVDIVEDDGLESQMQDGTMSSFSIARKLIHELGGHAVQGVARAPIRNAIEIENSIINEISNNSDGRNAPKNRLRQVVPDRSYYPGF
jgi:hypothetical protein